uniref:NEDD8-activating enzyme E1 catalytic subunit n=1 Tax=Panagrolaimus davidi TaxID=227884 RepID=A0A914R0E9_9BILA
MHKLSLLFSAFAHPAFESGVENSDAIQQCRVFVAGSGGLGCEIFKGLNIETMDMDTVDFSNLYRQFLFREADIEKSEAEVAANFVIYRVNDVQVAAHNCKIQDKDLNFYRQFLFTQLFSFDSESNPDPSTIIPFFDGGIEGGNPLVKPFGDESIDGNSPEHLTWIMNRAQERAK